MEVDMIGGQEENSTGMVADINITPLVDVMLVLLVIFMITAPLLVPQSLGINLPKTTAVKSPQQPNKGHLRIDQNGNLKIGDQPISNDLLPQYLADKARDEDYSLSIEADDNVRYGRVAEVLAIARAAGVSKIAFITVMTGAAK
jgi:biopolymer transport protein ExbD